MSLPSPLPTLQSLTASLQQLRTVLHPLLQTRFDTLLADLENHQQDQSTLTGRLDSAKLQVSIAYVLLDLFWIHLKLTGKDPFQHQVHSDLSRVKSYFAKIKACQENGNNHTPEVVHPSTHGRMGVDREAAERFIKSAIGTHTKFDTSDDEQSSQKKKKRNVKDPFDGHASKRNVKDPFDGYGSEADTSTSSAKKRKQQHDAAETATSNKEKKSKKKKAKK
ncbi:unnamed protein product [Sympodiomycopsis kandeliae]